MRTIEVTAPGKAIFHGEHAVVYGKAAIALSLGLESKVTIVPNSQDVISLEFCALDLKLQWAVSDVMKFLKEWNRVDDIHPSDSDFFSKLNQFLCETTNVDNTGTQFQKLAVKIFLYLYLNISKAHGDRSIRPVKIAVSTELSIGSGMGSSASYSVCLAAALLALNGEIDKNLSEDDRKKISDWAFCGEKIAHGQPSGIDNSICSYGGALLFRNFEVSSTLPNMPSLKILLVNTGVERNTKHLVESVKQKNNLHPSVISCIMDAVDAISVESWDILKNMVSGKDVQENVHKMQDLIKMNQHLLNCLDVSHPRLNEICAIAQKHVCPAKLTGAGGGGCAFILLPHEGSEMNSQVTEMKAALSSSGYDFWDVSLGGPGVTLKMS